MPSMKDYSQHTAIMISTDRMIFHEKSAVRARMISYASLYKELHIIIFSTEKYERTQIAENVFVCSTHSFSRFLYVCGAIKIGKKIIQSLPKDTPMLITCQDPFETGLTGKCLKKYLVRTRKSGSTTELLLQIHTDLYSPYFTKNSFVNKIRRFISNYTLPKADTIRVVSKRIADSLIVRGIEEHKILIEPIMVNTDVIKNGIPQFNLHEKFPRFKKIVLMASRLEKEKNVEMALEALASVLKRIPDAGLVVVGSGTLLAGLKKKAYKLNISHSVAFEGWKTDLISYYKGCDVFLTTSWYEGYGMTLVEAQSAGCKIVSTDVGIAREIGAAIIDWNAKSSAEKLIDVLR